MKLLKNRVIRQWNYVPLPLAALLIACIFLIFHLFRQNRELQKDIETVSLKNDSLQGANKSLEKKFLYFSKALSEK